MTRTENEQEFVLGNRQLLSAFFVVVMLLGVFFAMGYIIGHNSTADGAAKKPAQAEPAPATSPAAADNPPAPAPPAAQQDATPIQTEPAKPVVQTPEKAAVEKSPVDNAEPARIESTASRKYLQVSAVKRPAADSIVKTLKDKGFPALLGESSKPELFRVLVGPYSETEALSKAKSDLKAMGFDAVVSK
jgi:cell division septation protein DedD